MTNENAASTPCCAYCGKALKPKYEPMAVDPDEQPTKYHVFKRQKTERLCEMGIGRTENEGRPILRIRKKRAPVGLSGFEGKDEIHVWLGDYHVAFEHFCTTTCAARFGRAAHRGGYRMRKNSGV